MRQPVSGLGHFNKVCLTVKKSKTICYTEYFQLNYVTHLFFHPLIIGLNSLIENMEMGHGLNCVDNHLRSLQPISFTYLYVLICIY